MRVPGRSALRSSFPETSIHADKRPQGLRLRVSRQIPCRLMGHLYFRGVKKAVTPALGSSCDCGASASTGREGPHGRWRPPAPPFLHSSDSGRRPADSLMAGVLLSETIGTQTPPGDLKGPL